MKNKTLILDCDGVLYPATDLTLADFIAAMKKTFHQDVKVSADVQKQISEETLAQKHLGMYNYIKAVCDKTGYGFNHFCEQMVSYVDYSKISPDVQLGKMLLTTAQNYDTVILTNSHILHLDKVLQRRFNKSVFDMESSNIRCFDIQALERNGVFHPKQEDKALSLFADRIGKLPQDCVLIDDTQRNLDAAQKIGMQTVLINEDFTLKQYLWQLQNSNINNRTKSGRENG